MYNVLILLGSNFLKDHEYNLPLILSPNAEWKVFSIDTNLFEGLIEETSNHQYRNISVSRLNISLVEYDKIIFLLNSILEFTDKIYIMDSISCGFVTNTSFYLIDFYLKNNLSVYWTHYISPHNEHPTLAHTVYSDEHLFFIFNSIFSEQFVNKINNNDRVFEQMKTTFRNMDNSVHFINNFINPVIFKTNVIDTVKYLQNLLTMLDLEYISFDFIHPNDPDIKRIYKTNISCVASNTFNL